MKKTTVKRILAILAILFVGIVAFLVWFIAPFMRIRTLDRQFARITPGMSRTQVEALMGQPDRLTSSRSGAWWDDTVMDESANERIRKGIEYTVQTFYLPIIYEVTFDDSDRVVGRRRYD